VAVGRVLAVAYDALGAEPGRSPDVSFVVTPRRSTR